MTTLWNDPEHTHHNMTEGAFACNMLEHGWQPEDIAVEVNEHWNHNRTVQAVKAYLYQQGMLPGQIVAATPHANPGKRTAYRGDRHTVPTEDTLDDVEDLDYEVQQLREENTRLTVKNQKQADNLRIVRRKLRDVSRAQLSRDNLEEVILKHMQSLPPIQQLYPIPCYQDSDTIHRIAVLHISDIHCGEVTNSEAVLGLHEFNYQTVIKYFASLEHQVTDLIQKQLTGYTIDELFIVINGDLVSGVIHDELVETAEGTVIEAAMLVAQLLATFIARMSSIVPNITVTGVVGNHGRLKKDKVYKNKWANWDYVTMLQMKSMLREYPTVSVHLPKASMALFEANECTYLVVHGDMFQGGKKNYQRYLDSINALNYSRIERGQKPIKHLVVGHLHDAFSHEHVTRNGGWPGISEYSLDWFMQESSPIQNFWICEPHGPGIQKAIHLDHASSDDPVSVYQQALIPASENDPEQPVATVYELPVIQTRTAA